MRLSIACAGIHPHQCLPVMLDVGATNEKLIHDPLCLAYPHQRLKGQEYFYIVEEFVEAVQDKFPKALLQFGNFLTPNAYKLLDIYLKNECYLLTQQKNS